VAYVAEEDLVVLLVLNAHDAALFKRTLPAFNDLVASYQFVSAGVQSSSGRSVDVTPISRANAMVV
jgi:hypothetical protein